MFEWLVDRPIAHRGLHDRAAGRIENSLAAAQAAIDAGHAIECDVQISADGEAIVFHDFDLDRLTGESGPIAARSARELADIRLAGAEDCIAALPRFLSCIAGATPVIVEIKSAFDGDMRLAERVARIAGAYHGPIALKSFDPNVIAHLRREGDMLGVSHLPLGIVAEAEYAGEAWKILSESQRRGMAALTHWEKTRPDFLSWRVGDLPHATASLCRAFRLPVMAWTVRTPAEVDKAQLHADQIVFEGFQP